VYSKLDSIPSGVQVYAILGSIPIGY
jgi:hypothetical protein